MSSEFKPNVVQSWTRAGSWGGSGGRDPPSSKMTLGLPGDEVPR